MQTTAKRLNIFSTSNALKLAVLATFILVCIPLAVIGASWFLPAGGHWQHLQTHLLTELTINSFALLVGVVTGTTILGVGLAALTSFTEFPGSRRLEFLLVLPLAFPAYVLGFVFCGIFEYSGPVLSFFRESGVDLSTFFSIRSGPGAVFVLSLALFPYVFLITKSGFQTQGQRVLEASQALGKKPMTTFWKVSLPLSLPWIFGSLLLVSMETLADFGTVSILSFETFTTAIYKSWYGFFSIETAARLSSILILFVFIFILAESSVTKTRKRYLSTGRQPQKISKIKLTGISKGIATTFSWGIFLIGVVIPFLQLGYWISIQNQLDFRFNVLLNSATIAGIASVSVITAALSLCWAQRFFKSRRFQMLARVSTLGYALPGSILAVGVYIPVAWLDRKIANQFQTEHLLTGSLLIVVLGLTIRFLAVGYSSTHSGFSRINTSIDEATYSLGKSMRILMFKIHAPLIFKGALVGLILAFIDALKEMPLTLMTRPFGWDTLAVQIFELTSEGEWQRAALPSLLLVLMGFIPTFFLNRQYGKL